jgi:hypothetical protein
MRDMFGIFCAVIRIRKPSLLLVMTLRMPNNVNGQGYGLMQPKPQLLHMLPLLNLGAVIHLEQHLVWEGWV